jgi:hypothetical protein
LGVTVLPGASEGAGASVGAAPVERPPTSPGAGAGAPRRQPVAAAAANNKMTNPVLTVAI